MNYDEKIKSLGELVFAHFVTVFHEYNFRKFDGKVINNAWYQIWGEYLIIFPVETIKKALHRCAMSCDRPPSVASFMSTCEHVEGLLDFEKVYAAINTQQYSHPFVKQVCESMGGTQKVGEIPADKLRDRVKQAYNKQIIENRIAAQERAMLEIQRKQFEPKDKRRNLTTLPSSNKN